MWFTPWVKGINKFGMTTYVGSDRRQSSTCISDWATVTWWLHTPGFLNQSGN